MINDFFIYSCRIDNSSGSVSLKVAKGTSIIKAILLLF